MDRRTTPGDFTPQAEAYARARPGYPQELVDRLIGEIGVRPGDPVADIGAGTGIFSELLARRGFRVSAVEPNDQMRELGVRLAGVEWSSGSFESTGLDPGSHAWVSAAQSFHWAEPVKALPELRRILKEGGHLTVLWNNRDVAASEILTATREIVERRVPDFDEKYRDRDWGATLTSTGDFDSSTEIEVRHAVIFSPRRYLDLWRSHNLLSAAAGPSKMKSMLEEIEVLVSPFQELSIPYRCRAWTVRVRKT